MVGTLEVAEWVVAGRVSVSVKSHVVYRSFQDLQTKSKRKIEILCVRLCKVQ